MASKDLQENIKNQIAAAKKVNESLTRMLADILKHVKNFRALNDVIQKPEIATDYRDLDYGEKLEFIEDVEPPLQYVTQILEKAKKEIDEVEQEFERDLKAENAGSEIAEIASRLRENKELSTLAQQESEVKKTLLDLKERRRRFADCNLIHALAARKKIMEKIKELYDATNAKFIANQNNVEGLLALDSTKPARKQILEECKANELVEFADKISKFDGVWSKI